METYHPLEDQWAVDSLNGCIATRSLYRERKNGDAVVSQPCQNLEHNDDLEGVIAKLCHP